MSDLEVINGRAYPVLPAVPWDYGLRVWCKHCKQWHHHGVGEGHRLAHCFNETPYTKTGYILKEQPSPDDNAHCLPR